MFDLQGHRGARALFPENTLEGFQAALALGLRTVEIDVGVTRDGAVVVHHDPALNPDTTRDRAGAWLNLAALALAGEPPRWLLDLAPGGGELEGG